jgi:succinate dehydrogenase / fumarate reductase cytochrome b subunit
VTAKLSFLEKHDFLLRRLHSITGVLPVGLFLITHLLTNSSIVWGLLDARQRDHAAGAARLAGPDAAAHGGVAAFQHEVNFIHSLPFLYIIEIFGLWLPILFHSVYGFYIIKTGRSNVHRYRYGANWRYSLQRISGWVGFVFIFYHVATLRWGWTFLVPGGTRWTSEYAASTLAAAIQGTNWESATATGGGMTVMGLAVAVLYMLGVSLLVFHFANGLWTWAITWGLTVSRAAQRRWGYACVGLGAGLMVLSWAAIAGFVTLDVKRTAPLERELGRGHAAELVEPVKKAAAE